MVDPPNILSNKYNWLNEAIKRLSLKTLLLSFASLMRANLFLVSLLYMVEV